MTTSVQAVARAWLLRTAKGTNGDPTSRFRQEVEGKRFRNPETKNEVKFVSLPPAEQTKIYQQWLRGRQQETPARGEDARDEGVVEYVSPRQRELTPAEAKVRETAYALKRPDPPREALDEAVEKMAPKIRPGDVLVPVPSSRGDTKANLALARALAESTGTRVADVLEREAPVSSSHQRRQRGERGLSPGQHGMKAREVPEGNVVFIDNVTTTGSTFEGARQALPGGRGLAYAQAKEVLAPARTARLWLLRVAKEPRRSQMSQFRQEVEGKKFRNPNTGNQVKFVSLPKREQARIFSEWRRRQRGDEPRKEKTRGVIKVDKERAREKAGEIADSLLSIKLRDPDDALQYQRGVSHKFPHDAGRFKVEHVKGWTPYVPVKVDIADPRGKDWAADRKFAIGGRLVTRSRGPDEPGFPVEMVVTLDQDVTPRQLRDDRDRLEREIYDILIHETTHAQDVLPTPRKREEREKGRAPAEEVSGEEQARRYYNKEEEVRAFKQQVADELEKELEELYADEDEPDWIGADAEAVERLLERSTTWERVRRYLTPKNRRKYLETAASVVRKFKEERGGKVAARRVVAAWVRQAISKKYVDRLLRKVDTDDLPFDHLFSGRRRMVVDPEEHGGLGATEPDSADKLEKFMRDNGVLEEGDEIDWGSGLVLDEKGKTKSKIGKAIQKAMKKFVGPDREFHENLMKVRRGIAKGETPLQLTLGVGRDNLRALTGMGHLFSDDFPTDEIWQELETYGSPSPTNWKRLKEVADEFAELTPEERREKTDEHEREYHEALSKAERHPSGLPRPGTGISEDFRTQYWDARGLFQTHNKAKRGEEADWLMNHFRKWADRTDELYESEEGDPVRKVHDLGAKLSPERREELLGLSEIDKQRQAYDLWRSIRGEDLSVVLSRDPIDVLRMSDHPKAVQAIQSCHSEGGSEFQCAIEEAEEGGLIAYVVKKSDVEGKDLDEGELFEDKNRGIKGIKPFARLRLRRFESGEGSQGKEVAVPETTTYGADFPDFVPAMTNWAREEQPEFLYGDAGYSKRPRDWRLTGGTYQDAESSELFDNFFDRDEDDAYYGEPTEDEYDPYGEGYTPEDSPYYDPEGEDEDEGEAEVAEKSVEPWRETDRMSDFWSWMTENHPKIRNPNRRGKKEYISPSTLKGYARGAAGYSGAARETVRRYLTRYREEREQYAEARARGDVRASRAASARSSNTWYHGSPREFDEFEQQTRHTFGEGASRSPVFLSPVESFAELYAPGPEGTVYEVRADVEKTFDPHEDLLSNASPRYWPPLEKDMSDLGRELLESLEKGEFGPVPEEDVMGVWAHVAKGSYDALESDRMKDWLRSRGYDSFYVTGDGPKNLAVMDTSRLKITSRRPSMARGGTPFERDSPDFKAFLKERYEGGRSLVPNPRRDTTHDRITINYLLSEHPESHEAKRVYREYEEWKASRGATTKVACAWLRRIARQQTFEEWVEGRRFQQPKTKNLVLFESLEQPVQERIRAQWGEAVEQEDARPDRPAAREVVQSERWGEVEDVRDEADAERQGALAAKPDQLWERASAMRRKASEKGSFERKLFDEKGASHLTEYVKEGDLPSDEAALHILASQEATNDRPLARGIQAMTTRQVEHMFGLRPKGRDPVVVEYEEGRWVQPGRSTASSWSASGDVASEFSGTRRPKSHAEDEGLAGKWDAILVTEGGEEDGNFVSVNYESLLDQEHETNEEKIYERAFEMLVDKAHDKGDEDSPFLHADEPDEIFDYDEDEVEDPKRWKEAVEDLEEYYHYAAERLTEEGAIRDASVYSEEKERLGVGPVRVRRVYLFPSDQKPKWDGPRPSMMQELDSQLDHGKIETYDPRDYADEDEIDEDDYELLYPTRMAAERRERPKPRGGEKQPLRIDRYMVPAGEVFGDGADAEKVASAWLRRVAGFVKSGDRGPIFGPG